MEKFPPVSLEDVCVHGEEEKKSVPRQGEQTISNCVLILFSSIFIIAIAEEKTYPCTASHLLIIMAHEERNYCYSWKENHILKNKDP